MSSLPLSIDDVVIAVGALAAFVSVIALWFAAFESDPVAPRLKALAARREELSRTGSAGRRRPRVTTTPMRRLVERLSLFSDQMIAASATKLQPAGLRSRDAAIAYLLARACLPILFVLGAIVYAFGLAHLSQNVRLLVVLASLPVGALAPDIYVRNATDKRQAVLQKSLPDGLDLLVICAEAGLSLDAALQRVAREIVLSAPLLAEEFNLTALELGFLPDRKQALDNLNQRTSMPSIRAVINTLKQSEKYGTPLAKSLRILSAEFRDERLMKAEEKAARLPVLMTLPMVMFILPLVFIIILGPAVISLLGTLH